nr:AbrB/MazE/SpoVT family DNA-binding domain-containing protein [Haloplanus sp. XH21]
MILRLTLTFGIEVKNAFGKYLNFVGGFSCLSLFGNSRMSKIAEADDRGRIVIPREIRKKYGDRYRIIELDDRVELIPLKKDPIEGLRDAVGDAFDRKSIAEIKQEARDAAHEDAIQGVTEPEN